MVLRAVLAVMTLVGAVPFRVCTCGAAHHHRAPVQQAPEAAPACCGEAAVSEPAPHHDPDCHAVKPRCAMSLGVAAALPDMPGGDDAWAAVVLSAPPATDILRHVEATSRPPPRGRPLFLTLQVLRN